MNAFSITIPRDITKVFTLAATIVLALFVWQGNYGFDLGDEGFLWYGVQRVNLGEVPIRDFMAYDPGRYYWSVILMSLWGDGGIMALRGATAVFQVLGLSVGLLLIERSSPRSTLSFLLLVAITLALWMFPRHKLYDISLSIMLIGSLSFLIANPNAKRYFILGLCVGLAAIFGRNHGVYGVVASIAVMVWIALKREAGLSTAKSFIYWFTGVFVGYLPVLFMVVSITGFAMAFWEGIRFLFEVKATNLSLPVPWPWTVPIGRLSILEGLRGVLIGIIFIAILGSGALGVFWVFWQKIKHRHVPAPLVASIFLIIPYAHFVYSRADINHLAQGIFPLLITCFILLKMLSTRVKWVVGVLIMFASLIIVLPQHSGWQCYTKKHCIDVDVAGDTLSIDPYTASNLTMLSRLSDEFADNGRSFIAVPLWPGAYAAMERKSPMWEIYPLFPRSEEFQREEVMRIEASSPGFIMVYDWPLDGLDELRFSKTHPIIVEYIRNYYEPVMIDYTQNSSYFFFIPKQLAE